MEASTNTTSPQLVKTPSGKDLLKRKVFLIIGALTILGLIGASFFLPRGDKSSATPSPANTIKFELVNIFPQGEKTPTALDNLAIEFTFTKSLDKVQTGVVINPQTEFGVNLSKDRKTLFVFPLTGWIYERNYTITITPFSEDGQTLPEIKHTFSLTSFKESQLKENFN